MTAFNKTFLLNCQTTDYVCGSVRRSDYWILGILVQQEVHALILMDTHACAFDTGPACPIDPLPAWPKQLYLTSTHQWFES